MHDYEILKLLIEVATKEAGCRSKELLDMGRHPSLCKLRDTVLYLARQRTGFSFPELGTFFKRDSSTIVCAVNREKLRLKRGLPVRPGGRPLAEWHSYLLQKLDAAIAAKTAEDLPN
jgi:hypothetical protein